jgi:hypothetical protein
LFWNNETTPIYILCIRFIVYTINIGFRASAAVRVNEACSVK